jgi:L-lactate dehydrogenase complex protein LldG
MDRVSDYRAFVVGVARHDVAAVVGERLALRELNRVVVPEGIPDEWLALVDAEVVPDSPELSFFDLDQVDGVLSTCTVAIAETGTLVLTHGLGQGRRALTLVPDYLLVVVNESDIELNRVEGVHGPRTLEVLVVLEELSVADHAGRHRGVGDFVDEHEAPGDSVLAVVVDDERIGGRERGETDLVRR